MSIRLDNSISISNGDSRYLKLDASNDPLTGGLTIQPATDTLTALVVNDKDSNNVLTVDTINNRLGIGTASPGAKLDIQSATAGVTGLVVQANAAAALSWYKPGIQLGSLSYVNDTTAAIRANVANLSLGAGGTDSLVTIQSSGNVGIGTTSPGSLLNIVGNGASNGLGQLQISNPTGNTNTGFSFDAGANSNAFSYMDADTSVKFSALFFRDRTDASNSFAEIATSRTSSPPLTGMARNDFAIWNAASGKNLYFGTNDGTGAAIKMTVLSTGNVGIGTPSPTSRIHGVTTLSADTGDEIAYQLNYTTNKATSGNDTGLLINQTDTASPGTSLLLDLQKGGTSQWKAYNYGDTVQTGDAYVIRVYTTSGIMSGSNAPVILKNETNTGVGGPYFGVKVLPTYNQSGATGVINTDLLINRTETSLGTTPGTQLLIDAQVGGVSKLSVSNTGLINYSTTATITANTTQTQGQTPLTTTVNEISVVANANDVVTMPTASAGLHVIVINNGANTLQIFPASGDNLGAGVNTSITLASGSNLNLISYDSTNWEQL